MQTLLGTLTATRCRLLATLRTLGPSSARALAKAASRDYQNVHGDVHKLVAIGLVDEDPRGNVSVLWQEINARLSLDAA